MDRTLKVKRKGFKGIGPLDQETNVTINCIMPEMGEGIGRGLKLSLLQGLKAHV